MNSIIVRKKLIELLEENGVIVEDIVKNNTDRDFNITDFITDSIQWISLLVSIEETFKIECPDNMLSADGFNSFNGMAMMIYDLINEGAC